MSKCTKSIASTKIGRIFTQFSLCVLKNFIFQIWNSDCKSTRNTQSYNCEITWYRVKFHSGTTPSRSMLSIFLCLHDTTELKFHSVTSQPRENESRRIEILFGNEIWPNVQRISCKGGTRSFHFKIKPDFHIIAPVTPVADKITQRQLRLYGNRGVRDSSDGAIVVIAIAVLSLGL